MGNPVSILRAQVESQTQVDSESGLAARRTLFALAGGFPLPADIEIALRTLSEFERAILECHPGDDIERLRRKCVVAIDGITLR